MAILSKNHLIEINERIRLKHGVPYSGYRDYPVRHSKLEELISQTPKEDIIDTAAYYLKNIVLLQPFADGNHRIALIAVELFLHKNRETYKLDLNVTAADAERFQKELYRLRKRVYGNYKEQGNGILDEKPNEVDRCCRCFIEEHLTQSDQ